MLAIEALASLGAADWLNWLVLGIPTGFAQGFSILMSQKFGAADHDGLKKSVAMSIELSALVAVLTLAMSQIFLLPTLNMLNTPDDVTAWCAAVPAHIFFRHTHIDGV